MDPYVKSFFVIYFLILANVLTGDATGSADENNDESFVETTEDNSPRDEVVAVTTKTDGDSFSTISAHVTDNENITDEFKPSVHLGEIEDEEPITKRRNPFNDVHHVKFDDGFDVGSSVREDDPRDVRHRILYDINERENGRIVFDDENRHFHVDNYQQRVLPYRETIQPNLHFAVVQSSRSPFLDNNLGEEKLTNDRYTFLKNLEKPTPVYLEEHTPMMMFDKPMRFPYELREHLNLGGNGNFDDKSTFYFVPDYRLIVPNHPNNYYNVEQQQQQQQQQETGEKEVGGNYGNVKKANDMTVYLARQHEYTNTPLREQPHYYYYYYYQPVGYHEMDFLGEPKPAVLYPKGHRISPWRKIIHLIGTFLPLGLLLAALAPNVIKIQNTTDPNIVLSKLRVVDLPIEHKQARLIDERRSNVCEDRSICELILAGGKPGTNMVQNVLWNLAVRSNEEMVRKIGLREIFEAVKKKSCATIVC